MKDNGYVFDKEDDKFDDNKDGSFITSRGMPGGKEFLMALNIDKLNRHFGYENSYGAVKDINALINSITHIEIK